MVHALKIQAEGPDRHMLAYILLKYLEERGAPVVIAAGGVSQLLQLLCDSDNTCKSLAAHALDLICDKDQNRFSSTLVVVN